MKTLLNPGEFVVGLDIGGTKMYAAVMDHTFEILGNYKKKTRSTKKPDQCAEERIFSVINAALKEAGDPKISAIGVGSPGPLNPEEGVIIDTPNLGWKNFPLAETLSTEYKVPVAVDNDVNVGTYGEWCFGEVKACKHVVGIFPGTGIGGGIVVEGKLLHGFSGAAGEVGHITVERDGPLCGCGKRGCLEAMASRLAIAKEVATLAARGDAPYVLENFGTDIAKLKSGAIAEAIASGEKQVEAVVRHAAYLTGMAIGGIVNVLSPEAVVLGGGLVEAMEEIYLEEVGRGMRDHAMPFLVENVRLVAAKLGDDAVALGAARMAAERLRAD